MFRKLLVPLDRSPMAEQALGYAVEIARLNHAGVDVMMVHDKEAFPFTATVPDWAVVQTGDDERYLREVAAELETGASVPASCAVVGGNAVDGIVARAHEVAADLIVMTSHGRTGLSRMWLGSVADGVIRRSHIPVLLLRPTAGHGPRVAARELFHNILVPIEDISSAGEILDTVMSMVESGAGTIRLVHVVRPVPLFSPEVSVGSLYPIYVPDDAATESVAHESWERLGALARRREGGGGHTIECEVAVSDNVTEAIINSARQHGASLVAMTTHGRGLSRLLLGSAADKIIRTSSVPLLLLHGAPADVPAEQPAMASSFVTVA